MKGFSPLGPPSRPFQKFRSGNARSHPATPGPNPLALVSARIKAAQAKRESRRKPLAA